MERLLQLEHVLIVPLVKTILSTLLPLFMSTIFSSNCPFDPSLLKQKNDLLQMIKQLSTFSVDDVFEFFLTRLNSRERLERIASLWILKFVVQHNPYDSLQESLRKNFL